MASIRRLKKDIDFLTYSVMGDCLVSYSLFPDKKSEAEAIMQRMLDSRNDLRQRLSRAGKFESSKEIKAFYKEIFEELLKAVNTSFAELNAIVNSDK